MKAIYNVRLSAKAERDLKKVPLAIAIKLEAWIEDVASWALRS